MEKNVKHIAIVGFGSAGAGCAAILRSKIPGLVVTIVDDIRDLPEFQPGGRHHVFEPINSRIRKYPFTPEDLTRLNEF